MAENNEKKSRVAGKSKNASTRFANAITNLRRNPRNRLLQRHVYMVGKYELTPVQVDILEAVVANPEQKMAELAQALGVNASTASRTTLPLVELGLIERKNDLKDRRVITMSPTPNGIQQAKTIHDSREKIMRSVQSHFTKEEINLFADLMEKYIKSIDIEGEKILNKIKFS